MMKRLRFFPIGLIVVISLFFAGCMGPRVLGVAPYEWFGCDYPYRGEVVACESSNYVFVHGYLSKDGDIFGEPKESLYVFNKETKQAKVFRNGQNKSKERGVKTYVYLAQDDSKNFGYVKKCLELGKKNKTSLIDNSEAAFCDLALGETLIPVSERDRVNAIASDVASNWQASMASFAHACDPGLRVGGPTEVIWSTAKMVAKFQDSEVPVPPEDGYCLVIENRKVPQWVWSSYQDIYDQDQLVRELLVHASEVAKKTQTDKSLDDKKLYALLNDAYRKNMLSIYQYRTAWESEVYAVAKALATGTRPYESSSEKVTVERKSVSVKLAGKGKGQTVPFMNIPFTGDVGLLQGSVVAENIDPETGALWMTVLNSPGPQNAQFQKDVFMCPLRSRFYLLPKTACYAVSNEAVYTIFLDQDAQKNAVLYVKGTRATVTK